MFRKYYEWPALNWFFRRMGMIPVAAGDPPHKTEESLAIARRQIEEGHVVSIFAEGASTRTGNLLKFKRGFERIASGVDCPIVPIYVDGIWGSIFSYEGGRFFFKWPKGLRRPITVVFGEPMPSSAKAHEVRSRIQELSAEAFAHRKERQRSLAVELVRSRLSSTASAWSTSRSCSRGSRRHSRRRPSRASCPRRSPRSSWFADPPTSIGSRRSSSPIHPRRRTSHAARSSRITTCFRTCSHVATLWLPVLSGARVVYGAAGLGDGIGELAAKERVTLVAVNPPLLARLTERVTRAELSTVRFVAVGGEDLPDDVRAAFAAKFGIEPLEGYGRPECAPIVSLNLPRAASRRARGDDRPSAARHLGARRRSADRGAAAPWERRHPMGARPERHEGLRRRAPVERRLPRRLVRDRRPGAARRGRLPDRVLPVSASARMGAARLAVRFRLPGGSISTLSWWQ